MNISDAIFRIVDVESTGMDLEDRVCEVAWRDVSADGTLQCQFQSLIDPGVPMKPGASAIHQLVDEDVRGKPKLLDVLGHQPAPGAWVAHNAEFDARMLGLQGLAPFLCTYRMAKHVLPEQESYSNQYLRFALKLEVDLPKDTPAHRAAADVAVTAALFRHLLPLARAKWPTIDTVEALIAQVQQPVLLNTIRFSKYAGQPYSSLDKGMLRWIVDKCDDRPDDVFTAQHYLKK